MSDESIDGHRGDLTGIVDAHASTCAGHLLSSLSSRSSPSSSSASSSSELSSLWSPRPNEPQRSLVSRVKRSSRFPAFSCLRGHRSGCVLEQLSEWHDRMHENLTVYHALSIQGCPELTSCSANDCPLLAVERASPSCL